ncbi:MAG: hypothetical protein LBO71_09495 [Prevotellaceae bacterium]|nr:hypothetical protein [Prevotellaceae bacterium]
MNSRFLEQDREHYVMIGKDGAYYFMEINTVRGIVTWGESLSRSTTKYRILSWKDEEEN